MQIGLTIFPTDYSIQPPDLTMEAEARDFGSLWLPEHSHIPTSRKSPWPAGGELPKYYYDSYDPFISLGAAAAVTKKIKLATGICLVVERDPIHTAKEVSTVDRLSSGRFIFGVGGGWNDGSPLLTAAGLWDEWKDRATERLKSCTTIITEPNDLAAEVHDRMPVLLTEKQFEHRLSGEAGAESV
jgi:alkanesulfonate monooxygenase SsuD/methylene tetrahydromethanopterin reductase-like flavin-dependent oxidoreductase (luciferase family)